MTVTMAELDHLFLFVQHEARAYEMMAQAGLRVNYSRAHKGQGTRNICACLDDMFLELLWLDGSETSAEAERITLPARGRGKGSPIGVSWRGPGNFECTAYAAPYLAGGVTIPVARSSLDPSLPFVFQSPGGIKPIDRKDGLVGTRQFPELTVLGHCELIVPNRVQAGALLAPFDRLSTREGAPGLSLKLLDATGQVGREFVWTP